MHQPIFDGGDTTELARSNSLSHQDDNTPALAPCPVSPSSALKRQDQTLSNLDTPDLAPAGSSLVSDPTPRRSRRRIIAYAFAFAISAASLLTAGGIWAFFKHGAEIGKKVFLEPHEHYAPLPECDSERIKSMSHAFAKIEKTGYSSFDLATHVILKDRKGHVEDWDKLYPDSHNYRLAGRMFHVPLERFRDFGYEVYYDKTHQLVLMRYQNENACIIFSRLANSEHVMAYWHQIPTTFSIWLSDVTSGLDPEGLVPALMPPVDINCCETNAPAIADQESDPQTMLVPVRIFAASLLSKPITEVDFYKGTNFIHPASGSTVRIFTKLDIVKIRSAPGAIYSWKAPGTIVAHFPSEEPQNSASKVQSGSS